MLQIGFWIKENIMEREIERIFNRQYERLKSELLAINMPQGYLTIISKYWDFLREDIERIKEDGTAKSNE